MENIRSRESLAALIVHGKSYRNVIEDPRLFLGSGLLGYRACALGMAFIALMGSPSAAVYHIIYKQKISELPHAFYARELGISKRMAHWITLRHVSGIPALQIAEMILDMELLEDRHIWRGIKAWFQRRLARNEKIHNHGDRDIVADIQLPVLQN